MADEAAPLDYAPTRNRRRRSRLAIVGCVALCAIVALLLAGPRLTRAAQWLSAVNDRRTILRGTAATGRLDLSLTADQAVDPAASLSLYRRIAAWTTVNGATRRDLDNLLSPRPTSGHGDPGSMLIGRLRASDGQERLASIGANVMLVPERSMLLLRFNVELFAIGSWRTPSFVPLKTSAARQVRGFTPGVYESHRWLGVDVRLTPGDPIWLGAPSVDPGDSATVRFPITVRGETDELLFTLKPGDQVDVRRASGKGGRFDIPSASTRPEK